MKELNQIRLRQDMSSNDRCPVCDGLMPSYSGHLRGQLALEIGYCSWLCLVLSLDQDKADDILRRSHHRISGLFSDN